MLAHQPPQIARANGIDICYEIFGDPAAEPLLLIMGLGAQMIHWDDDFCRQLAARGFRVIRFDNRDIGKSSHLSGGTRLTPFELLKLRFLKIPVASTYRLIDMAKDTVGLMDALGLKSAHLVGASMGGMIAQEVALSFPQRVRSLTSIMSTTGNPRLPRPRPAAMKALTTPVPPEGGVEAYVRIGHYRSEALGSPGYPADQKRRARRLEAEYRRSFHPTGGPRQYAAILADGDRRRRLRNIVAPTLVIHGEDDPLLTVHGGQDTAAAIAGARLLTYPGMGHDLPIALVDPIADAIAGLARESVGGS